VVILCGPEPRYADRGVPVAVDVAAGKGPLGALMTGLRHLRGGAGPAVLLAVDLPDVPAALLAHLVALLPGHDLVVPVTARGPEPLCAVYAATCLPPVEEAVGTGDLKMTSFWPAVRRREVGEAELAHFGDPAALFRNINTPGDLTPE
jgi:molybdopterin-guanine dinucleotide biosynthesis protein A